MANMGCFFIYESILSITYFYSITLNNNNLFNNLEFTKHKPLFGFERNSRGFVHKQWV